MSSLRSYLCKLVVGLTFLTLGAGVQGQQLFLDPDTVFVTTGAGTEFDLDLRVDANTQGIRLFQAYIAFDTALVDTVSTALGPLFENTSYIKLFNSYIYYDTTLDAQVLRLEGLLFGATAVVNGPGIVAQVRLVTKGTGRLDMDILQHLMTDISNEPISSTAEGAVLFINYSPSPFNLLVPGLGEEVTIFPDSNLHLYWEPSTSVYTGEGMTYTCEVSSTETFDAGTVLTFAGLTDTTADVDGSSLTLNHSYWYRVTAIGDTYGFEQQSTPFGRPFYVREAYRPPGFHLKSPVSGGTTYIIPGGDLTFVWDQSAAPYPIEDVLYRFELSTTAAFDPPQTISAADLVDSFFTVDGGLLAAGKYFWRVKAYGSVYGTERNSIPWPDSFNLAIGADPGEFNLVSPADGGYIDVYGRAVITFDWEDAASIIPDDTTTYTLTVSTDPGFGAGTIVYTGATTDVSQADVPADILPLPEWVYWKVVAENRFGFTREANAPFSDQCFKRGDVIADYGSINVADLTYIVAYIFQGGPPPVPYISGDLDCANDVNVADLTFLVGFLFQGGAEPYCP